MDKTNKQKFWIAFIISLASAVPLRPGSFFEWTYVLSGILWGVLLIWVFASPERKYLVYGILTAIGLLVVFKLVTKFII
jgi:hypothetical protein